MTAPSSNGRIRGSERPQRQGSRDSYYGRPILKEPVWTEEIPAYFFLGGMAGASATLGLAAGLAGNERLERSAWSAAFAGVAVSPALLISDLGRPARFLNMMRMFRITSPMSMGSWILAASGAAFTAATARAWFRWPPRAGALAAAVGGGALGPGLATYTGVLLADTAVPVWHEARRFLPFVFAGSAMASAGGAAAILTPAADAGPARRLALAGATLELASSRAMERHLGPLAKPYKEEAAGRFSVAAKALTLAGTAMLTRFGSRRTGALAGGALLLSGSACERFAVFHAGRQSARDPHAVVGPQRARQSRSAAERRADPPPVEATR